jgi:serine/threonine protein kinase/LysM repeat protein
MVARDKEDLSGQQIGNYEIESHIAARKASDLFLARDVKLERLVLLEVLRVTEDEDEDLTERFHGRMETVSQLKDPHIAVVSDLDVTDDGFPYAVIDYFPGETLAEKLADLRHNNQTLPVIESLELAKQIAQGLGVAHAAGLIHHDLRPQNVMLREDGTPVLIDLGVPIVSGPAASSLNGPEKEVLDYASPEELEGKPLTRRSNVYSLGVILYELLAGHQPNLPTLPFDIFPQANMPKEEPLEEARPGLAGETYRLVRNCLWRQEWSRFETTDEMITAIETAIFAEQELPKAAAWTPQRSNSMKFIVPVALVLVGILAFFLLRGVFGGGGAEADEATREGTPDGTFVAAAETPDPNDTPTATATLELPTESSVDFSISVLPHGANRIFTAQDTINFDWFWPTLPEPDQHFAVYLLDGEERYLLGTRTEPYSGAAYRLSVPAAELPASGELAWQVRLETIDSGEVIVESDNTPIVVQLQTPTPTPSLTPSAEPSETAGPTETVDCVMDPPPGWILYTIRQGDSLSNLAERANIPVETLLRVNCLPNDLLSVGQQVWVPQASVPRTPTPAPTNTSAPPPRPSPTTGGTTPEPPPPTATTGSQPPTPTEPPPVTEPPPTLTPEPVPTATEAPP